MEWEMKKTSQAWSNSENTQDPDDSQDGRMV